VHCTLACTRSARHDEGSSKCVSEKLTNVHSSFTEFCVESGSCSCHIVVHKPRSLLVFVQWWQLQMVTVALQSVANGIEPAPTHIPQGGAGG